MGKKDGWIETYFFLWGHAFWYGYFLSLSVEFVICVHSFILCIIYIAFLFLVWLCIICEIKNHYMYVSIFGSSSNQCLYRNSNSNSHRKKNQQEHHVAATPHLFILPLYLLGVPAINHFPSFLPSFLPSMVSSSNPSMCFLYMSKCYMFVSPPFVLCKPNHSVLIIETGKNQISQQFIHYYLSSTKVNNHLQ